MFYIMFESKKDFAKLFLWNNLGWCVKGVKVVPVVIGALRAVTPKLKRKIREALGSLSRSSPRNSSDTVQNPHTPRQFMVSTLKIVVA